jgi:hypothetical protein
VIRGAQRVAIIAEVVLVQILSLQYLPEEPLRRPCIPIAQAIPEIHPHGTPDNIDRSMTVVNRNIDDVKPTAETILSPFDS